MKSQYRYRLEEGRKKQPKKPFPYFKLLFLVVCVITVCVLGVKFSYSGQNDAVSSELVTESDFDACLSSDCIKTSYEILSSVDSSIDPCDDFYEFACGKYKTRSCENIYSPMQDENQRFAVELASIIKEPIMDNDWQSLVLQKKLYQACIDTDKMDNSGMKYPFLQLINNVGGWPVVQGKTWSSQWEKQFYWKRTMMLCRRHGLSYQWFIKFSVDHTLNLTIMAPEVEENDDFDEIVYKGLMEDVAVSMGAPKDVAHEEMQAVFSFKKKLEALQKRHNYEGISFKPLGKITWITFPLIRWTKVLEELKVSLRDYTEDDNVFVQEKYLGELGYLLEHTPVRTQANYIMWKVVEELGLFFPMHIRGIFEKYTLYQNKKLQNRADICVEFAKLKFPYIAEASFVQRYIDQEDVKQVTEILENIKNQYKKDISTNDWIDKTAKTYAIKKIESLKSVVGFKKQFLSNYKTSKLLQWEGFALRDANIIDMLRHYNQWIRTEMPMFDNSHQLERIFQMTSRVNAYLLLNTNTIIVTPGLMTGRGFNKERPNYLNYAVIGIAMSHEIAHGLDSNAEVTIDDVVMTLWQMNKTYMEVEDILDCIRIQHVKFQNKSAPMNTIFENFADLIGIQKSYKAYKNAVGGTKSRQFTLPGLDYTPNQLFWLRYATVMCDGSEASEKKTSSSDEHGDSKFRINMILRNYESFAKDFKCAAGSKMNPLQKCRRF